MAIVEYEHSGGRDVQPGRRAKNYSSEGVDIFLTSRHNIVHHHRQKHFIDCMWTLQSLDTIMHFYIALALSGLALADSKRLRSNQLQTGVRKRPHRIVDPSDVDASSDDGMTTVGADESSMWRFLLQDDNMSISMNQDSLSPTSRPPLDAPSPSAVAPPSLPPVPSAPPTTACPSINEPCMNEENLRICTDLIKDGCQDLLILESCPLQFQCGDSTPPPPPPNVCPSINEPCMNEENLRICTDFIKDGCQDLLILESCPLQFQCGDVNDNEYPSCGGIAGIPCDEGLFCYTGISNDCDEDCGAADCLGKCRKVLEGEQCLGFAGFQCPNGSECFDEKGDGCSPNCGGADCIGICLVV